MCQGVCQCVWLTDMQVIHQKQMQPTKLTAAGSREFLCPQLVPHIHSKKIQKRINRTQLQTQDVATKNKVNKIKRKKKKAKVLASIKNYAVGEGLRCGLGLRQVPAGG